MPDPDDQVRMLRTAAVAIQRGLDAIPIAPWSSKAMASALVAPSGHPSGTSPLNARAKAIASQCSPERLKNSMTCRSHLRSDMGDRPA